MTSYGNYGMKLTKSNHLYRNTKVGVAMFDAIQELFELKKLTPQQALIIVTQFDVSIRKIMNKKIEENYSFFSFEAEVKAYRLQSGWCSVVLENVAVYQHFRTREIQMWYKNEQERKKREGGKTKYFRKEYCDRFKKRYVQSRGFTKFQITAAFGLKFHWYLRTLSPTTFYCIFQSVLVHTYDHYTKY